MSKIYSRVDGKRVKNIVILRLVDLKRNQLHGREKCCYNVSEVGSGSGAASGSGSFSAFGAGSFSASGAGYFGASGAGSFAASGDGSFGASGAGSEAASWCWF